MTVITSIPVDDCWMRDSGPVFRTDGAGGLDAVGLNFNGWGGKQAHGKDARVAERVAAYTGVPFRHTDFVGEGGAIEQDGAGTLMATRSSLLNRNRNPGKPESELAAGCATRTARPRSSGSTASAARTSPTTTSTPHHASWPRARPSSRCLSRRTTTPTPRTPGSSTASSPVRRPHRAGRWR
ncbi:agmatine deiminase family protein [Streptomyces sp. RHZ10]|uniref:Agmatine deiminase family protein n=1 Tax=Streptomyces durocortorensis TaxID=2811104 RepID=A0ABS2HRA0_9ACTN|nr:agmatine deiminase family protein [Streptomyces durocortorensis]